MNYLSLDP